MKFIPLFIFLFVFMAVNTYALSLVNLPSQREYTFEPGLSVDIPFSIGGSQYVNITTSTPTEMHPETLGTQEDDNILNYITIEDNAQGTGSREVIAHIRLPQRMKPGFYRVVFTASEPSPVVENGIGTVVRLGFSLIFWVLSDEKQLDFIRLTPMTTPEGLPANVTIDVISRTKQTIDAAYAEIRVYDGNGTVVTTITPSISIPSGKPGLLSTLVPTEGLEGGDYLVNATIYYDGGKSVESTIETLKIGTLHVDVPSHSQNITYNSTNRFIFNISNKWNKELQEVYAVVNLSGQELKKTASQNIPSFGSTAYEIYFDRDETLIVGPTTVNVTVTFKDYDTSSKTYVLKTDSFLLPLDVILPPSPPKKPFFTPIVILAVSFAGIIVILVLILIIMLFRRPKQTIPAGPTNTTPLPPSSSQTQNK